MVLVKIGRFPSVTTTTGENAVGGRGVLAAGQFAAKVLRRGHL